MATERSSRLSRNAAHSGVRFMSALAALARRHYGVNVKTVPHVSSLQLSTPPRVVVP